MVGKVVVVVMMGGGCGGGLVVRTDLVGPVVAGGVSGVHAIRRGPNRAAHHTRLPSDARDCCAVDLAGNGARWAMYSDPGKWISQSLFLRAT